MDNLAHVSHAPSVPACQQQLERLIDLFGYPLILEQMAAIAYAKAEHIKTNWQDEALARSFDRIGDTLTLVSENDKIKIFG